MPAAGAQVDTVVAYERRAPIFSAAQIALAQEACGDGSVWLFSSSEAVAHLQALLPPACLGTARALATHPRIAQTARLAGFAVVGETSPTLNAIVASIESQA